MKHLLKLGDLTKEEIIEILDLADKLKYEKKNGIEHHLLKGKTLGMIFQKSSTRTRVSFEVGIFDLGGTLAAEESKASLLTVEGAEIVLNYPTSGPLHSDTNGIFFIMMKNGSKLRVNHSDL